MLSSSLRKQSHSVTSLALLAVLIGIWTSGCRHGKGYGLRTTEPVKTSALDSVMTSLQMAPDWPDVYEAALVDARNPEPSEVVTNLTPITTQNPELQWKEIDGTPHVKMVSLVSTDKYYRDSLGKNYNTGTHNIWVTAVPQVENFVSGFRSQNDDLGDLENRLRQRLGLTPTATINQFVEFWVDPNDLFRPAPDNEISDSTAGLALPDDTEAWYRRWFNDLRASQYFQSTVPSHDAYPWTQLGYTYDWGDTQSKQGFSEFVIRTDVTVVVDSITDIEDYGMAE